MSIFFNTTNPSKNPFDLFLYESKDKISDTLTAHNELTLTDKIVQVFSDKWVKLRISFLQKTKEGLLLANRSVYIERKQFEIFVSKIGLSVLDCKAAEKNDNLVIFLHKYIVNTQRKSEHLSGLADKDIAAIGLSRPQFNTLIEVIKKIKFSKAGKTKKVYIHPRKNKILYPKPDKNPNPAKKFYTVRQRKEDEDILLNTHWKKGMVIRTNDAESSWVTYTVYNVSKNHLEIRAKETWLKTNTTRTEASEIESEIVEKLRGKNGVVQYTDILQKESSIDITRTFNFECGAKLSRHFSLLSEKERALILRDAFEGLHYLHQEGYVHFNLDLDSILFHFNEKGNVTGRLSAFRNARKKDSLDTTKKLLSVINSDQKLKSDETAFSPEILLNLIKRKMYSRRALETDLKLVNTLEDQELKKFLLQDLSINEALTKVTGKNDIWQLGVKLAYLLYKIPQLKLSMDMGEYNKLPCFVKSIVGIPDDGNEYLQMSLEDLLLIISEMRESDLVKTKNSVETKNPWEFLLSKMIQFDPNQRFSAKDCVQYLENHMLKQKTSSKEEIPDVYLTTNSNSKDEKPAVNFVKDSKQEIPDDYYKKKNS